MLGVQGAGATSASVAPPEVVLPERWWPGHTEGLLEEIERQLGLAAAVVDVRRTADARFAVALDARLPDPPAGTSWIDLPDLSRDAVADLLDNPSAAPWLNTGWLDGAVGWVDEQLAAIGSRRTGDVVQLKHWSIGAVFRVPASPADVVFKQASDFFVPEGSLLIVLSELDPGTVPEPLAVDGHRWLMPAFEVERPETAGDAGFDECLRAFARLQISAADAVDRLTAAGAPDKTPAEVGRQLRALAERPELLTVAGTRTAFLASLDELVARCAALDDGPVPTSVGHGDLHQWNTTRADGRWVVYDWTDASVTHPFFDLCPWLWHIDDAAHRRRAASAYLDEWSAAFPAADVAEAWRLAEPVAAAYYALDYVMLHDGLDEHHRGDWGPAVAVWLQRAIDALEAQAAG